MPWRRVGPARTQRERTKTSKGKEERNTEESTYNRKQRNFTCSVVLMHQSMDRERDRQMERRRACEKTWILTLIWRSTVSCPALPFWNEHTDKGRSDSAFAICGGRVRFNHKSRCRGGERPEQPLLLRGSLQIPSRFPSPPAPARPRSYTGMPTLEKSLSSLCKVFLREKHPTYSYLCLLGFICSLCKNPLSSFPTGDSVSRMMACFGFTAKSATNSVLLKFPFLSLLLAVAFNWFQLHVLSAITNYSGRTQNWLGNYSLVQYPLCFPCPLREPAEGGQVEPSPAQQLLS